MILQEHQILLSKLNHYGIHGISNDWFKFYMSNCNHYVSLNGYESGLTGMNCGGTQRSFLGPLLLLLYINDLNKPQNFIKFTTLLMTLVYYVSGIQSKNEQTSQCRLKASS